MDQESSQLQHHIEIFELFYFTKQFISEVDNIADTYKTFIPLTVEEEKKNLQAVLKDVAKIRKHIDETEDDKDVILSETNLGRILDDLMKTVNSPKSLLLVKSLFIYLFTSLENLISELLFFLYLHKRELLGSIERCISVSQLMNYQSVDDAVKDLIMKELDSFRRNSFVKQFSILEHKFGVKLTKFDNWPTFVECAQRRNLFTHCNGVVSQQYLDVCRSAGYEFEEDITAGSKLQIQQTYFVDAINIVREVGIKFSQTIWRKFFPERLSEADQFLIDYSYKLLSQQNWELAQVIGEYSIRLPDKFDDAGNRLMYINLAIALYHLQGRNAAQNVLHQLDWSSCIDDFRLAVEVLNDNFDEAANLMHSIGTAGKYITKNAYLEWPLFDRFRESPQFLVAYQQIYGTDFITDIKVKVEKMNFTGHEQLAIPDIG